MAAKPALLLGAVLAILLLVSHDVAHVAGEGGQIPEGYGPYTQPGWGGSTPYNPPEKKSMRGGGQMGKNGSGSYP
ncbi:unnamed protein product [Alopecurus aequalis]